jgi:hypothetical protein
MRRRYQERIFAMLTNRSYAALLIAGAFALAGPAFAAKEHHEKGGHVVACSLHGVNPAHHPDIFGDPATAKRYGFVQSSNGKWHVIPGCRRHARDTET